MVQKPSDSAIEVAVEIRPERLNLPGTLTVPPGAVGLVLFAHGSGSSRMSPRNRFVARVLHAAGIGTLLFDLLTPDEDRNYSARFDISLLSLRLARATRWVRSQPTQDLPIGYFGASTGAAAALVAAAERPDVVRAVVSRGGRPDLAGAALASVRAPTLLIVGGNDAVVLQLNHEAMRQFPRHTTGKLEIVPDASHLFEEPGTLDRAAVLARDWFRKYLAQ